MKLTAKDLRVIRLQRKFWRIAPWIIPALVALWTVLMMIEWGHK